MKIRRSLKWKRSRRELSLGALAVVAFLVSIYFLLQQKVPSGQ